jgi:hypothetical protein
VTATDTFIEQLDHLLVDPTPANLEAARNLLGLYQQMRREGSFDASRAWPDEGETSVIEGGRRCAIEDASEIIEGWWVGYSPRNGRGASVEGPWGDWVALARAIITRDEEGDTKP